MSKMTRVAENIYQIHPSGSFFYRKRIGQTRELRALRSRTLAEAIKEASEEYSAPAETFGGLALRWMQAGCPNAHNEPQSAPYQKRAGSLLVKPMQYFGHREITGIDPLFVDDYFAWRSQRVGRGGVTGRRITDLELTTASAVFRWAVRRNIVPSNPFAGRGVRQKENLIVHCTARAPVDADTVHRIATALLSEKASESCGWLFLWLSLTGCRCAEMRELRLDGMAQGNLHVAGSFTSSAITIQRAKMRDRDGAIQPIPLQTAAQALLPAWRHWHATRHPANPYWFPGRRSGPLDPASLAHSLSRVCTKLGIQRVQPHGCRSFFTKVMRSVLPDDRQVADLLGHSSVKLVERIYGRRSPSDGRIDSFLPSSGSPAWLPWVKHENAANIVSMPAAKIA